MTETYFNSIVEYLQEKGVTFTVKTNHIENTVKLLPLSIVKRGKFFGVVNSGVSSNPGFKIISTNVIRKLESIGSIKYA